MRFDARGHGQSEATKGAYTFETLAADMIGADGSPQDRAAHYLGLSMGGMVGQYLGLLHPERFHSLQLVSTSSRIPDEGRAMWDERVKVAREKGMASQVEPAHGALGGQANRKKPALVARLSKMIETTPVEGYAGWCGASAASTSPTG